MFDSWKKIEVEILKRFHFLEKNVVNSFSNLKDDMKHVGSWIEFFKEKQDRHDQNMAGFLERIERIERFIEFMKNEEDKHKQTSVLNKQTSVYVQTPVQTAVQTGPTGVQTRVRMGEEEKKGVSLDNLDEFFSRLTLSERAVIWVLLNTDLKLSYEDLAAALGKDKSTLRGQINNIKQKSEGILLEFIENSGKKRFYLHNKIKERFVTQFSRKKRKLS